MHDSHQTRDTYRVKSKVVLLGDEAVGKTSLIRRFVLDQFKDEYIQTLGSKVTKKELLVTSAKQNLVEVTMMIWDVVGQREIYKNGLEPFSKYVPQKRYFFGSKGAVLVCDLTRRQTLRNLPLWVNSIFEEVGEIPLTILGNKEDLVENREVTDGEIVEISQRYNAPFLMTSAKTGKNVEAAFYKLSVTLVDYTGVH